MCNNEPPKIYVASVPDEELNVIPSDAIELTSGVDGYIVNDEIEGLSRPDADISISALAGANASRMSSGRITERNIVFDVIPLPNTDANRERLYKILPFDTMLRFFFVKGDKQIFIDGKIEKLSGSFKPGKPFSFTVSILCPFPWFQSVQFHERTFLDCQMVAVNDGDIPSGFTFYIDEPTDGNVINYMRNFELIVGESVFKTKEGSGKQNSFNIPMILSTITGEKMFYVEVDGFYTSMAFSLIDSLSEWLMLQPGENIVSVSWVTYLSQSTGTFDKDKWMRFTYRDTYSGV